MQKDRDDVYYYVKCHQILLSRLTNYLVGLYVKEKWLEREKERLESGRDIHPDIRRANIAWYDLALSGYRDSVTSMDETFESWSEYIKPFSAILPLEQLARPEYSSKDVREMPVEITTRGLPPFAREKTTKIYVLEEALSMIEAGRENEGYLTLDAVGRIKTACLGFLLLILDTDPDAMRQFRVLQDDSRSYYDFIDRITETLHIEEGHIPDSVTERRRVYRESDESILRISGDEIPVKANEWDGAIDWY